MGTSERPRVCLFRSNANLYLQLVDDTEGRALCAVSTLSKEFKEKNLKSATNVDAARMLADLLIEKLKEKNVARVVFDRSGYRYHGKVRVMAERLRESGLLA